MRGSHARKKGRHGGVLQLPAPLNTTATSCEVQASPIARTQLLHNGGGHDVVVQGGSGKELQGDAVKERGEACQQVVRILCLYGTGEAAAAATTAAARLVLVLVLVAERQGHSFQ